MKTPFSRHRPSNTLRTDRAKISDVCRATAHIAPLRSAHQPNLGRHSLCLPHCGLAKHTCHRHPGQSAKRAREAERLLGGGPREHGVFISARLSSVLSALLRRPSLPLCLSHRALSCVVDYPTLAAALLARCGRLAGTCGPFEKSVWRAGPSDAR